MIIGQLILEPKNQSLVLCAAASEDSSACLVQHSLPRDDGLICLGNRLDNVTVPTWSIHLEICTWLRRDRLIYGDRVSAYSGPDLASTGLSGTIGHRERQRSCVSDTLWLLSGDGWLNTNSS